MAKEMIYTGRMLKKSEIEQLSKPERLVLFSLICHLGFRLNLYDISKFIATKDMLEMEPEQEIQIFWETYLTLVN